MICFLLLGGSLLHAVDPSLLILINSKFGTLVSLSSWIFARKWPDILRGLHLHLLCSFLNLSAWMVVVSPVVVLVAWGCWLIVILGRDIIGLAVIMAGIALLLAFYSIMLWWRTQWQSSSMSSFDFFFLKSFYNLRILLLSWCTNSI